MFILSPRDGYKSGIISVVVVVVVVVVVLLLVLLVQRRTHLVNRLAIRLHIIEIHCIRLSSVLFHSHEPSVMARNEYQPIQIDFIIMEAHTCATSEASKLQRYTGLVVAAAAAAIAAIATIKSLCTLARTRRYATTGKSF